MHGRPRGFDVLKPLRAGVHTDDQRKSESVEQSLITRPSFSSMVADVLRRLHHLSARRTLVASAQDCAEHHCRNEPVDQERDFSSVSTFRTCRIFSLMYLKMFSASLLLPDRSEFTRIGRIFDNLGPTSLLCLELLSDSGQMRDYERDVEKAILTVTADSLEKIIREATAFNMDVLSHKILLLSREERDDVHSLPIISPLTHSIQSRLASQLRYLEQAELIRMYKRLAKDSDSRATAGIPFESAAQLCLQDTMNLELVPMVRLANSRAGTLPRWHSSHNLLADASLDKSPQEELKQRLTLTVRPSQTVEYRDARLLVVPNVFYVPASTNQVALDSFIIIDGLLYIFQFTIASVHDIHPGLANVVEIFQGLPTMDKWRFIFVIPPSSLLIVQQPKLLESHTLHPYSAVIQFDT